MVLHAAVDGKEHEHDSGSVTQAPSAPYIGGLSLRVGK
jgi:hypothetical protein